MNADVHALAGAYALDALPPEEAAAFSEHLAECGACQQEVMELRVTAVQLGLAAAQVPPPEIRARVLRAAHDSRQIPPITAPADLAERRRRRWRPMLAAAAAAAVVVAGGLLGLGQVLDDGEPGPQDAIAAVMDAPDARPATARLRGGGSMTVVSSDKLNRAVVISEDLPALPPKRVYQLWLVGPEGDARSADVLIRPDASAGRSRLVEGLQPGDRIAITREPAGGSEQPSMAPLAMVEQV